MQHNQIATDLFKAADVRAAAGEHADTAPYSNQSSSKAAAKSIESDLGRLQQRIFDHIKARPSTAREVEDALGLRCQTVTARIRELVLKRRVVDSGEKRATDSGRLAIVWKPTE